MVGAKVRLTYENAPKWTGTSACSKALTKGAKKLGVFLQDKYGQISSIGGYSCRKNTADSSRMSVHGTGRALDIMIPTKGGTADNSSGDPIANWLIVNAQKIGVQLIIWDHSIWRANGTNDGVYGGPIPHIDHLHVELTTLASTQGTAWFADPESAVEIGDDTEEVETDDAGVDTSDGAEEDPWGTDDDAGTGNAIPTDPGPTDPPPHDAGAPSEPDAGNAGTPSQTDSGATTTPPKADTLPSEDDAESEDDSSYETTDDEAPTEANSLGTSAKKRRSSATLDDVPVNKGCSVPSSHGGGASGSGFVLAVAVAAAMVARRKKS
ncbi:hypothetical protein AKJ09_01399 [Labilithrix luteola]|uniref:ARB-07466-like C-terminal domain-containing protein n=1 Tax=Labilithrix luteola TaxID=1391654 RepID=A0A0K1PMH9_9BACT|nr:hypothetical protein AKJ09_01399 [Labilithrix luteola]